LEQKVAVVAVVRQVELGAPPLLGLVLSNTQAVMAALVMM
jgi:hypothetical protein